MCDMDNYEYLVETGNTLPCLQFLKVNKLFLFVIFLILFSNLCVYWIYSFKFLF